MDTQDLEVFVAAISAGSLAGAGRRLGITAMAASRALAALEQRLGTRLLHRTTRSISLTPEGEEFLPYARSMLELNAAALGAVAPQRRGVTGTLKVTCPHIFGRVVLMPLIKRLLAENPGLSVNLLPSDSVVDIVEAGIDVAIRMAHMKDSGLVGRALPPNPRVLCASPEYLGQFDAPECLADLQTHECLYLTQLQHWPFEVDGELQRVRVSGRFACCSAEAIRSACLQGLGIGYLTRWDVADEIASGELIALELKDARPDRLAAWALMPSARHVPQRVRVFLDALIKHLES